MYIRSLEKMEEIVRNRDDLSWDGWDVLQAKPKGTAYMKKDAAYIDGESSSPLLLTLRATMFLLIGCRYELV